MYKHKRLCYSSLRLLRTINNIFYLIWGNKHARYLNRCFFYLISFFTFSIFCLCHQIFSIYLYLLSFIFSKHPTSCFHVYGLIITDVFCQTINVLKIRATQVLKAKIIDYDYQVTSAFLTDLASSIPTDYKALLHYPRVAPVRLWLRIIKQVN